MNNTTIGIILVTTTAVMIIASTNLTPMIQHRQGYAASPTSSFKDNIRANLENRNQHLNQQGNCIRTNGCTTSDVGQGTLGNDNSVTGFTDQSNNIKQSAPATGLQQSSFSTILRVFKILECPQGVTCPNVFKITIFSTGDTPDPHEFVLTGIPNKFVEQDVKVQVDSRVDIAEDVPPTPPNLVLAKSREGKQCNGGVDPGNNLCFLINRYTLKPAM